MATVAAKRKPSKKTAKVVSTYDELMAMAVEYGVENNAMFISAAKQYAVQMRIIDSIEKILSEDELLVSKEYVKSRENVYSHPLVKELPKHADSANKTLGVMLEIISKLGQKAEPKSELGDMMEQ